MRELKSILTEADRICLFAGAGTSVPSGIPDFRSSNGLYADDHNTNVFDIDAFNENPALFYRFANWFYPLVAQAKPNALHHYMTNLQSSGKTVDIITQNIDDLHEQAGSRCVHHVHGRMHTGHCRKCDRFHDNLIDKIADAKADPLHCKCGGIIKPDITFFGEMLSEDDWAAATNALRHTQLLIVAGSSLQVYPAAALPSHRHPDAKIVILNRDPTPLDAEADLVIRDDLEVIFKKLSIGR